METKDITKAKPLIWKYTSNFAIDFGNIRNCIIIPYAEKSEEIEAEANAELICEAFKVANETGLSPKQMQERIKDLEEQNKYLEQELEARNGI